MGEGIWNYEELKRNYSQGIKIMVRTFRGKVESLPSSLLEVFKECAERNPAYQQVYFDDEDCLSFIKENFPQYLSHYNVLVPRAYKADFFRALFLYKYGGIYNDISHRYLVPVEDIVGDEKMVLASDRWTGKWGIFNAFMATGPEEELFKVYIQLMVERIEERTYATTPLDITGPGCFWDAFLKHFQLPSSFSPRNLERLMGIKMVHFHDGGEYILEGEKRIIKTKVENYYSLAYPNPRERYGSLWIEGKVYAS